MSNSIKKYLLFYVLSFLAGSTHLYAAQSVNSSSSEVKSDLPLLGLQSPKMVAPAKPFKQSEIGQKQIKKKPTRDPLPRSVRKQLAKYYCRLYKLPSALWLIVILFVDDDRLQYRNKELPKDLSNQDLTDFDFTGCTFEGINLTGTILKNVILTNTTCNYIQALEENFKQHREDEGTDACRKSELKDLLEVIHNGYKNVKNHAHQAQLLKIACGVSRIFCYPDNDLRFRATLYYWYYCWLRLKRQLRNEMMDQEIKNKEKKSPNFYKLRKNLQQDESEWCWQTSYKKKHRNSITLNAQPPHNQFQTYLEQFQKGFKDNVLKPRKSLVWRDQYKKEIEDSIKGLEKAYPYINQKKLKQNGRNYSDAQIKFLQKKACQIAHLLSNTHKLGGSDLLYHYLTCKYHLAHLLHMTQLKQIYCNEKIGYHSDLIWS